MRWMPGLKRHKSRQDFGQAAEEAAVRLLKKKGHKIIRRNYAIRDGELDIISRRQDTLVFTEVRARKYGAMVRPEETVDRRKQAKIRHTAQAWLLAHPCDDACRFDVIACYEEADGRLRLEHYENAF
ncbi:YraN family protein [Peptococcus simiae]|uniref:YraN family protein n=1 Tax=Peptococcus simiae TaxID=1643805 RepID=UPI00397EE5B3